MYKCFVSRDGVEVILESDRRHTKLLTKMLLASNVGLTFVLLFFLASLVPEKGRISYGLDKITFFFTNFQPTK